MESLKVMVALRDAESVESLVKLACTMAGGKGSEVTAIGVVEVAAGLPLNADAEILDDPGKHILALASTAAAATSYQSISTRLIRARSAGEAIVAEAAEEGFDLIVMGYHQKHGFGEFFLGSTVRYVMQHAPCRVLVQVPPVHARVKVKAAQFETVEHKAQELEHVAV